MPSFCFLFTHTHHRDDDDDGDVDTRIWNLNHHVPRKQKPHNFYLVEGSRIGFLFERLGG